MSQKSLTWPEIYRESDKAVALTAVALLALGILTIFSACMGVHPLTGHFALKQFFWGLLAAIFYVGVLKIGYVRFLDWAYPLYGLTLLVLLAVFIVGETIKGAQSWFSLGPLHMEPSEFGKVALALFLSKQACLHPPKEAKSFFLLLCLSGISGLLVLLQPDLGGALVYGVMIFAVLAVAGAPKRFLWSLVGFVGLSFPFFWGFLKEYQRLRLIIFLNPMLDPMGAGYNVIQSRIAVGSGGLFGKGFLAGTQSKLHFLPEPHTDFIFSVYAEEFGFLGSLLVLSLFAFLLWRLVQAGLRSRDPRAKLLVVALTAWIWFQIVESVAMSMGLAPITGLPLPLFSYGGSSLLAIGIALGLIQSVAVYGSRERLD